MNDTESPEGVNIKWWVLSMKKQLEKEGRCKSEESDNSGDPVNIRDNTMLRNDLR
jgi:hypothetical protein